jgi:acyl carrier protein
MSQSAHREKLLAFLHTIRRPDRSLEALEEREDLVESGLIDSLALLQIIDYLEAEYGIDFRERGVDPGELASIESILELIESQAE